MAGLIPQERLPDVEMHLQNNLLYMKVDSINHHLIKMILGPSFQHCRSIYLLSRSEALIDMVPKSDVLIEEVLSLSGTQEYRNRTFQVTICLAQAKIEPNIIADYALALVSPHPPDSISSKNLLANRDWIEFRVRRNSTTSQSTYPVLDTEKKSENASDITGLDPNAEVDRGSETDSAFNPEYTPSKKYFPLSIPPFGEEDPGQFTFAATKNPPPKPPEPKKPDTLDLLTQAMCQLDTEELRSFIGALMIIDKQREGRSDHISLSPELDQARDPPLGGKVGIAGGRGVPQHDPVEERFGLDNPNNPTSTPNNPIGNAPTTLISDNSANPRHLTTYPELQTSFQAMSEGFLKAALKEGVLRQDTPKLHEFSGKPEDGKASWRRWELQIKGLVGSYSDRAIREAMNKALQGDAAIVADSMDDDCTWQELLAALKAKFTVVSSLDVMMANLYGIKQGNNSVSQFAINIEKVLGSMRMSLPTTFSTREFQRHLRTRFFHGLNDRLRNSLRHKYETDCSYEELLQYARMVESEKSESGVSESVPAKATKAKASSAQQPQQQSQSKGTGDLVRLEKAYRSCQGELAKMQRHLQQMQEIKSSWDASAFQSSTDPTPQQNSGSGGNSSHSQPQNQNSSPQNSGQYPNQNQNYNSSGRGYRGRGRGRSYGPGRRQATTPPGKPEGWNRLCFWCRDFATFDDANHPIKECPYYKEVRKEWWQHQQQTSPSQPANPTSQNPTSEGNQ